MQNLLIPKRIQDGTGNCRYKVCSSNDVLRTGSISGFKRVTTVGNIAVPHVVAVVPR
jgi:hypothetical protein